jgi:hypothetical protein
MNVASLENCRKLFELSGWVDTHFLWLTAANNPKGSLWRNDGQLTPDDAAVCPAYDLGYLLRKLPPSLPRNHTSDYWMTLRPLSVNQFEACYRALTDLDMGPPAVINRFIDSTPEDVTARLLIRLFETGILKKGETDATT